MHEPLYGERRESDVQAMPTASYAMTEAVRTWRVIPTGEEELKVCRRCSRVTFQGRGLLRPWPLLRFLFAVGPPLTVTLTGTPHWTVFGVFLKNAPVPLLPQIFQKTAQITRSKSLFDIKVRYPAPG